MGNNPVNWVDPYGLFTWPYSWKGWVGLGAIMVGAVGVSKGIFVGGGALVEIGLVVMADDIVEGTKEGQKTGKEIAKNIIKQKIKRPGADPKTDQEEGLLPSCEKLKEMGFTAKELEELGMCWCN